MEQPTSRKQKRKEKRKEALRQLSAEELQALRSFVLEQQAKFREGKRPKGSKSLRQIADEAIEEAGNSLTDRTEPMWEEAARMPADMLRPGAAKQMLRKEEEDSLPLDRVGHGNVFSPRKLFGKQLFGKTALGQRDFAWGIFATPEGAERALSGDWSGRDPAAVLSNEEFYFDVLRRCHHMELTLMLLTSRPLPLKVAQSRLEGRLREGAERLSGGSLDPGDAADIKRFVSLFDEDKMAKYGLVQKGSVPEGTHLLFSTTPGGEVVAEAITPGTVRDRKGWALGLARNPLVTGALFETFLGLRPVDPLGKEMVGSNLLWCANGLRLRQADNQRQYRAVVGRDGSLSFPPPDPAQLEWLPRSADIFRFVDDTLRQPVHMLLGRIRRAQERLGASPS